MAVAHCEEMLPGVIIEIRIDDIVILVDFSGVGRDVSFFGAIREPHDVLKEVVFCF